MIQIITNSQRNYLGLQEIDPNWKEIEVKSENFHNFNVVIFVDGTIVRKCIIYGETKYKEMQLEETLTDNLKEIIREDGKTSSLDSIINKSAKKVTISFDAPNISIYNESSKKTFYSNYFEEKSNLNTLDDFKNFVNNWCETMTNEEMSEMIKFSGETKPENISYKEGDIFRVKLTRNLYGYGKIALSYKSMKENNIRYWNCVMETPVVASLYHILTENKNISISELEKLESFPSEIVTDSNFVTGNYEIIGNVNIDEQNQDYPIMYGRDMSNPKTTFYQCGKTFLEYPDEPIFNRFKNNGIRYNLGLDIELMKMCILENSNNPYYQYGPVYTKNDLRNPQNKNALAKIKEQLNLK